MAPRSCRRSAIGSDYRGRSVLISGDTRYNQNVIKYGAGVDVLIHEVGMARPELMSRSVRAADHRPPHHAARGRHGVDAQAKPKLGVYTHIVFLSSETVPEPTLDDLVAETRQSYGGPLEIGEDLTSFDIGETVTVRRFKP